MLVVTAFANVRPEARDQAREALLRAQTETLKEDGCESYRYFAALDDDTSFVAVENWRDLPALQAHLASTHIADLSRALTELVTAAPDIRVYEATPVDPG